MFNYAYIVDGIVTTVLVFDDQELPHTFGTAILVTEETGPAAYGYTWDGTVFTPPTEEPTE
jgi:hypothetical protein